MKNEFFEAVYSELIENGFIDTAYSTHCANVYNEKGETIGDFLEAKGFNKVVEVLTGDKTWVEFEKDGIRFIGHRDIDEAKRAGYPNGTCYFPYITRV